MYNLLKTLKRDNIKEVNMYEEKDLYYESRILIEFVVSENEKWYYDMNCCSCGFDSCYNIWRFDIEKISQEITSSSVELNVDLSNYRIINQNGTKIVYGGNNEN